MPTFIDGIGSCQVIDKSGEVVDLKGLDITSLDKTGTFTWEHQSGTPATLVGKILKAKKIFSKNDCSSSRELYFWNKCKAPYLYVRGELLDDYTNSAKECAGQMRYSKDNPHQQPLLGFSIEGSEIPNSRNSSKMIVSRGIARKTTLTQAPCNSACVAEIDDSSDQKSQIKDDFEEIFKTEANAITLFKSGEGVKIYEQFLAKKEHEPMNKKLCKAHQEKVLTKDSDMSLPPPEPNPANAAAMQAGATRGNTTTFGQAMTNISNAFGKSEGADWSKGRLDQTNHSVHFSHPEHGTVSIQKQPSGEFHVKHQGRLAGIGGVKGMFSGAKEAGAHAKKYMTGISQNKTSAPKMHNIASNSLTKAIEAGSYNAAPSTLVNGAAYQTESLGSKPAKTGAEDHQFQGTKKKDWNKLAKEDYERWPHREKFEKFMKARLPHLHEGEIRAIGRTLALKKTVDQEKSLNNLISIDKYREKK